MINWVFKDVTGPVYRATDTVDFGDIVPEGTAVKKFEVYAPEISEGIVDVGFYVTSPDSSNLLNVLRFIGDEYPNLYGVFFIQEYTLLGRATSNSLDNFSLVDNNRGEESPLYIVNNLSVGTTSQISIVNANDVEITSRVDITSYTISGNGSSLQKRIGFSGGLYTLGVPIPYTPLKNDKYKITAVSTRYLSNTAGNNEIDRIRIAANSGRVDSPATRIVLSVGMNLPKATLLSSVLKEFSSLNFSVDFAGRTE